MRPYRVPLVGGEIPLMRAASAISQEKRRSNVVTQHIHPVGAGPPAGGWPPRRDAPGIRQQPPPEPPRGLTVTPAGDGLLVFFTASPSANVASYEIQLIDTNSKETNRTITEGAPLNFFFTGLPQEVHAVTAWAVSSDGVKSSPATAAGTPLAEAAPSVRLHPITETSRTSIRVNWDRVLGADGYRVYWHETNLEPQFFDGRFFQHAPKVISGGATTTAVLSAADGIGAGKRFSVFVLASSGGKALSGLGLRANKVVVVSHGKLTWMVPFRLLGAGLDTTLNVVWNGVDDSGLTGFLVQWRKDGQQYSTAERNYTAGPG